MRRLRRLDPLLMGLAPWMRVRLLFCQGANPAMRGQPRSRRPPLTTYRLTCPRRTCPRRTRPARTRWPRMLRLRRLDPVLMGLAPWTRVHLLFCQGANPAKRGQPRSRRPPLTTYRLRTCPRRTRPARTRWPRMLRLRRLDPLLTGLAPWMRVHLLFCQGANPAKRGQPRSRQGVLTTYRVRVRPPSRYRVRVRPPSRYRVRVRRPVMRHPVTWLWGRWRSRRSCLRFLLMTSLCGGRLRRF